MLEITEENIDTERELCPPLDIRDELIPDCRVWEIDGGWMALWPNGRGAICFGGDSDWGDWRGGLLILDDPESNAYNGEGRVYDGG